MKKLTTIISVLCLLVFFNCSTEELTNEEINQDPNFRVTESFAKRKGKGKMNNSRLSVEDDCSTNLIAGQNHIAGVVTVVVEGEDIIITYMTNEDWTINATHMSIGNCDEQWVPTTGSDNPKIGKFEHSTTHADGVNTVVYTISKSIADEDGNYCFAAHAEVTGPTGEETAWANGPEFEGKSWAMYVEAKLSECLSSGVR